MQRRMWTANLKTSLGRINEKSKVKNSIHAVLPCEKGRKGGWKADLNVLLFAQGNTVILENHESGIENRVDRNTSDFSVYTFLHHFDFFKTLKCELKIHKTLPKIVEILCTLHPIFSYGDTLHYYSINTTTLQSSDVTS